MDERALEREFFGFTSRKRSHPVQMHQSRKALFPRREGVPSGAKGVPLVGQGRRLVIKAVGSVATLAMISVFGGGKEREVRLEDYLCALGRASEITWF